MELRRKVQRRLVFAGLAAALSVPVISIAPADAAVLFL
jgi:hypothetical protein